MTLMQKAFEHAGLTKADAEFDLAIAKYINSGGTIERARMRLDIAAERMPGMDHIAVAREGQKPSVQSQQPVEDERGRADIAQEGQTSAAPPSSFNRGGDQVAAAQLSQSAYVPVREPSPQQRNVAASVAKVLAVTVMDTLKIDGTCIGDYSPARAHIEGRKKTREGFILREAAKIASNIANPKAGSRLRDLVKVSEMQLIIQKAAEVADAA